MTENERKWREIVFPRPNPILNSLIPNSGGNPMYSLSHSGDASTPFAANVPRSWPSPAPAPSPRTSPNSGPSPLQPSAPAPTAALYPAHRPTRLPLQHLYGPPPLPGALPAARIPSPTVMASLLPCSPSSCRPAGGNAPLGFPGPQTPYPELFGGCLPLFQPSLS